LGSLECGVEDGGVTPGEASHLLALRFDQKDYPDWLPNTAIADEGFSKAIASIIKGGMLLEEGGNQHLWPLGTEPPRPNIGPDSVRVTLRGTPVGEPTVRHCEIESGNWGFQAALSVKTRTLVFRVYRLHPDREELQKELDAIAAAGDVQVFGMLEDDGGGEVNLEVMVEHWRPVPSG